MTLEYLELDLCFEIYLMIGVIYYNISTHLTYIRYTYGELPLLMTMRDLKSVRGLAKIRQTKPSLYAWF